MGLGGKLPQRWSQTHTGSLPRKKKHKYYIEIFKFKFIVLPLKLTHECKKISTHLNTFQLKFFSKKFKFKCFSLKFSHGYESTIYPSPGTHQTVRVRAYWPGCNLAPSASKPSLPMSPSATAAIGTTPSTSC